MTTNEETILDFDIQRKKQSPSLKKKLYNNLSTVPELRFHDKVEELENEVDEILKVNTDSPKPNVKSTKMQKKKELFNQKFAHIYGL